MAAIYFFSPFFTGIYEPNVLERQRWSEEDALVILFCGDSIVAGFNLPLGFPEIVQGKIAERNNHNLFLYNMGVNGYTTSDILRTLPGQIESHRPDMVFIFIGWNDYKNTRDVEVFERNYRTILNMLNRAGVIPVLMTTTQVNIPLANRAIGQYNNIIRELAGEYNAPLLDIYAVWQQIRRRQRLGALLMNDNIHPTQQGQELIARTIWNEFFKYHFPF